MLFFVAGIIQFFAGKDIFRGLQAAPGQVRRSGIAVTLYSNIKRGKIAHVEEPQMKMRGGDLDSRHRFRTLKWPVRSN